MKSYKVVWEEVHSVVVEASNAEKAREMVLLGEHESKYDEEIELSSQPEVYVV